MAFDNRPLITAGDMSADITSVEVELQDFESFSIENIWTGAPVGDVIIQVSIDGGASGGNSWSIIDQTAAGGAVGDDKYESYKTPYTHARVFWDFTSGTGSLTSKFCGRKYPQR